MASNKKAQILAAVMCASSIFGSYTMVSAESSISGNNSSVVAGNGTITATAENGSNQTSKITLNGNSLSIDLAKNNNVYDGTFSLNSKYLNVNKYNGTVTVKGTTYTSDLANNGLTIKNSSSTLASLNNNGLNIYDGTNTKATATITKAGAITGTGLTVKAASDTIKPEGNYVESKVTTSGVADTIKQGGFTRATSNVTTNSIKDTIYTDSGTELSSINVFKNTAANGIENGKVSLTAKKIVTDNQTSTTTTSTLTLGGDNASLKVGNYGFTIDSNNNVLFSGKNASLTSTGLIVNGTGTSSIKSTNTNENSSTVGSYTKNDISYNGMTTTAKGGKYPSDSDNDNKTTSSVTYTGVRDTVYDDSGNIKSTSVVDTNGITLTSNRYDTGSKISSSLTIKGDSATLTSGTAYVKVDNTVGNVTLSGKNASLTSTGLTVNGTGTSSIKSTNATTEAYTKNDISYAGMTTTVRGGKNPSESDNVNKTISAVTYTGVTDTVYDDGGNLKTKSSVTTSGITNTVYDVSTGKALANSSLTTSGISNTTTDLAMTGTNEGKKMSTALYQNSNGISASATKKDESGATIGTSTLTLGGDNASLKVGSYGFAVDSNNNVSINGKNATLSGSTFTLKDATNGKTVASLGASGLSINNADGIKVGGISNTGYLMANDGMNVTDKNSSWVTIGTSTMQKDIAATTTTSYAGITNKIDTTLAGNKTYTSGTVVGPTSVTTTVQGSNTTDAISGNKNKTISTVSATGVTDTVYNVKGDQVASSNVTTNGIVNTTTNLSIDGSTNNTMSTSIYQDKRGISASATKKDENGTVGTSTLTLAGNSASLKVGNYGFAVDSNNNVSIAGNNATLSGSTFTLKDANGKTATLNTSGLTLKDEDGNTTGGISTTGAITGTSLNITAKNTAGNKTTSTVGATGVTDAVYGTDGARVAYSNVGTGGISNTTSLKTTTGKIDTAINQNTSGVGISSTKYDTNNNVTDKTSLTMNGSANNITSIKYNDSNKTVETTSVSVNGGTSSITSYGNYVYGEDGKATSYNQASMSLNGNTGTATIRGGSNTASSTLTLNEAGVALSGKNVGLNANGLTLYKDVDGVKTQYASLSAGGLSVNGTGYTTIKSTNATTGAIGQSQVSYNGVTDSFTKDGVTNSVTTNANGTTFSSTGNGSTTIKGDTIKTTNLIVNGKDIGGVATDVAGIDRNTENEDGLGYYTQIEGKTKIYNTGRFSTANGNFVVDPYGSITSKAGNYRFNMDRTNGFDLGYAATTSFTLDNTGVSLGFRNNSFILDKNGATFINANGENVSFTSINGGTITTGETVINGSSITTKDLYVDNIHLNGAITDGNGNVVGGGDLSLGADGTLDLKYNANGITNTFVSGATGVHSSFSNGTTTASSSVGYIDDKNTIGIKDQVGNTSVTTTTDGTTFANGSGSTTINGGNITTTGDVTVGGDLSVGDNFKVDGTTGNVTGGTYNGVQISTDKDGNAIIGGTNIGDLATNEEVNKVNDKVDAVDNKVGDTSKLDKEITDNQNYKDNQNLVGAVNAEADIRRNEISRIDGQIEQLDGRVGSLENRMSDVEDRIDKVGAMSAAIANLRTMGFDSEAPTEIAIGVGQYKSETGLALGVFHYPNQDFMLSASISTSGDEVMGGIGATWKLGRKSAAEKAKDEEARRLEKAEEMKKLAQDAKVKAQAERHAKLLAEREAQKTA
ncbi:YadA-like family protein [Megamonas funiformis]|uniref:YadA-like family protein n=1 Tax=Megamonas funiformis TaxID=437897 RepID=UPI002672C2FB|nr:YadA-like family protein [Megamonas funiformis]